jgi:beta-aspartyl-peptidase (threonine type)
MPPSSRLLSLGVVAFLFAGAVLAGWPGRSYQPCCPSPCAPVVPAPSPDDDRAAIRKVLDDQVAAWNRAELVAFMAGYWKSEELSFYSGNTRTHGYNATLQRYRTRYQSEGKEMGRLRFELYAIDLLGPDAAAVRGKFELTMKKDRPEGLFTLLFRRFPEGWRIVHDHTSTEPPPRNQRQKDGA